MQQTVFNDQTPALYLIGAGVCFPEHLTLEVIDVLERCKRIYTNIAQDQVDRFSEEIRAKSTSLWPLYSDQRKRSENYSAVIQAVLDALTADRPVAWLTPGHPLILDSVSQGLKAACQTRGWNVSALSAVSCLDTILTDLWYDPANGLLVHDATAVVREPITLLPSLATLLLQPGVFGSDFAHISTSNGPDRSKLRDYLLRFYPASHRCAFARSACATGGECEIAWISIGDVASTPYDVVKGSSLFIPAMNPSFK